MNESVSFNTLNNTLRISRTSFDCEISDVDALIKKLDNSRGVMLTSRYEYPGRYTRYDIGFVNPPLSIEVSANSISVTALNARGEVLIGVFNILLNQCPIFDVQSFENNVIVGEIVLSDASFFEEDRVNAPHVLNVIRFLRSKLEIDDSYIGFYGAFGYDLGLDFMGVQRKMSRDNSRDLILYFADEVLVTDHENKTSTKHSYDFEVLENERVVSSTFGIERSGSDSPFIPDVKFVASRENSAEEYAGVVEEAKAYFARGDLFEVVPSYCFHEPCDSKPSTVFNTLLTVNPAPFGALINLGQGEFTISASPEMFVRVDGDRVESCPIAGTIARGSQGISDAEQIEKLLMSEKEDSELIMCTDVDRNDKSRVCVPDSVQVIGRRQIEIYSRLIHTVDHVQGTLLEKCDAIDAFLTHMWAVTVTGAPKMWAYKFIEEFESSPRRFYGGAMGVISLDGSMNTGLMLRTIHLHSGAAHIRVGATLLFDSDPLEEAKETELKASAMLDVVRYCNGMSKGEKLDGDQISKLSGDKAKGFVLKDMTGSDMNMNNDSISHPEERKDEGSFGTNKRVLLIDCEDSFVHTLGSYFRIANADVKTLRVGFKMNELEKLIDEYDPSLICLSPGPGSPKEFGLNEVINKVRELKIPIFGVCLGLQALIEHFGGNLGQLNNPMHGKKSQVTINDTESKLFEGVQSPFEAGRYHSLYADLESFPEDLKITATSVDDGIVMAIEHKSEAICAVQFHPESIMTFDNNVGHQLISNVLKSFAL